MLRKELFQPLALATILAAGFIAVCYVADLWVFSSYGEDTVESREDLCSLPDGRLLVASHPDGVRYGTRYRDLEGNSATPSEDDLAAQLRGGFLPAQPPQASDNLAWDARVRSFPDGRWPATYWYFLSDARRVARGYFVGYDSKSKVCVGYLGTAGFRSDPLPAAELFPFDGPTWSPINSRLIAGPGVYSDPTGYPRRVSGGRAPQGFLSDWDVYVLGRDGKLYHADLQERTVQVVLENPSIRSVSKTSIAKVAARGRLFRLAARTDDSILVLDVQGRILAQFPIPEALRNLAITFAESDAGEAILYSSGPEDSLATEQAHRIYWVKRDGLVREATVTLSRFGELLPMQLYGGLIMPSPLGLAGSYVLGRYTELLNNGLSAAPSEALRRAVSEFWPALAIVQTISLALAILCYRRQVRYGASRAERIVWPLFVLLLGLPGWIGYRFGRSWPVLEVCPDCGVAVPRDRESCLRCTNDFPRPALKGTEVFA
jgi:hypothetical protein